MRRLLLIGLILLCAPGEAWTLELELGADFEVVQGYVYRGKVDDTYNLDIGTPETYSVYISGFPHNKISIGAYTSLGFKWRSRRDDPNPWYWRLGINSSFYFSGHNRSGLFLAGGLEQFKIGTLNEPKTSFSIGYQTVRDKPYIPKISLRYERWIDTKLNDFTLNLIFARRFGN